MNAVSSPDFLSVSGLELSSNGSDNKATKIIDKNDKYNEKNNSNY